MNREIRSLNKEVIKTLSAELGVPEEKVPNVVHVLKEALAEDVRAEAMRGVGRRALMAAGLGGLLGLAVAPPASAKMTITDDYIDLNGEKFYPSAVAPYSAIVYIDGTKVKAEDWRGREIARGGAGVNDAEVIQSALDAGGVIKIAKGTYICYNTLSLTKPNTILEGEGFDTIIKVPSSGVDAIVDTISVEADKCVVRDLQVYGSGATDVGRDGIVVTGANFVKISNVYVHHTRRHGILVYNGKYTTIKRVFVESAGIGTVGMGISLTNDSSYSVVDGAWIVNALENGLSTYSDDEGATKPTNLVFTNIITWNNVNGSGIRLWYAEKIIIQNHIDYGSLRGITIRESSDTLVENCISIEAGEIGFYAIAGSGRVKFINCHAENSSGSGFLANNNDVIFIGCSAKSCSTYGFVSKAENQIYKGCIAENNNDGFWVEAATSAIFIGCQAIGNAGYGLGITNTADVALGAVRVIGGRFENNTTDNIRLVRNPKLHHINGYENSGTATITSGNTSVTVSHGLVSTPSKVIVTPITPLGSASKWWVTNITDTSFDIVVDSDPAQDVTFAWQAEV